jgi:hypothetical protein
MPLPNACLKSILLFSSLFCGLLLYVNVGYGSARYILCGPDEDGCPKEGYQYCACIPYDEARAKERYCLDFDRMVCQPLSAAPNCDPSFIFKNQQTCLATIFQSEPEPPCILTTLSFCTKHHTYLCDKDGRSGSCHH